MNDKIKSAVTGTLAGIINGFLGAGGGMVVVPLLLSWLKLDERKALATSIFIISPLCAVSASVYFLRGAVCPADAAPFLAGGVIGGFLGGRLFGKLPTELLRKAFGIMMIYGGIRAIL